MTGGKNIPMRGRARASEILMLSLHPSMQRMSTPQRNSESKRKKEKERKKQTKGRRGGGGGGEQATKKPSNTATGFKTSHGALTQLSDHPKRTTTTTTKLQHKTKNRIRKLAFKLVIAGKSTNKKKSYQVLKRHTT